MTNSLNKPTGSLQLKRGKEKPIGKRHPWLFSGAIDKVDPAVSAGDLVTVVQANGKVKAIAYYNPASQISGRILSWGPETTLPDDFWQQKIDQAYHGRSLLQLSETNTNSYRLIYGESDGVPGLVVDAYDQYLVAQVSTLGIDIRKEALFQLLMDTPLPHSQQRPLGIVERSDAAVRKKEGLPFVNRIAMGSPPPEEIDILENGRVFTVSLTEGHKTGFYLDQRDNRELLGQAKWVEGKDVLNTFAYTGGFAVYAGQANAKSIINIDTSVEALTLAEQNVLQNNPNRTQDEYLAGDVFKVLREYRDNNKQFDFVILDPPKFAHSQRDLRRASRGYKDINLLAMKILRSGGLLATFSCSGLISADLFQKIVFGAAIDAGREVQIIHHLHQGADHPVSLMFPESAYLKGFLCRVW